jgi:zinc transporter 6
MIEGVLEVKDEHFWTLQPGVFVGSVSVRIRSDTNEAAVRGAVRSLLAPHLSHLTVQVVKDSWLTPPASSSSEALDQPRTHLDPPTLKLD